MPPSRQVRLVLKGGTEHVERQMVALAFEVHANLGEDTPRDTSFARSNWIPEIGKSFEGLAGSRAAAEAGSVDSGPSTRGLAALISEYRLLRGPIFLTNNVTYIGALNDGHSPQQPAGFVQRAIARGVRTIALRRIA